MIEKEARIHIDYTDGRRSSPEPSIIKRRAPAVTLAHCSICNHADAPSMMAHVGDGVYKCRRCLGLTHYYLNNSRDKHFVTPAERAWAVATLPKLPERWWRRKYPWMKHVCK